MAEVTDQAVDEYRGLVVDLATRISHSPQAKRTGAEYDDLVQEGFIAVWQTLARGIKPVGAFLIEGRMRNWVKFLGKRNGEPYATNLPLTDFRNLARQD